MQIIQKYITTNYTKIKVMITYNFIIILNQLHLSYLQDIFYLIINSKFSKYKLLKYTTFIIAIAQ